MCGIAGFLQPSGLDGDAKAALDAMLRQIVHRGPDDSGTWLDSAAGVALGHQRLAIIDLSPAGHQPMASADGRYVIVYNGEIYNFRALREELDRAGHAPEWRGHSDTEVLLAAIVAWGVAGALQRASGMFAFALWDREHRRLMLARDRMGEKPLYYGWQGEGTERRFLFASDLAAINAHPGFVGEIDPGAIGLVLRQLYVPDPYSVYRGIAKVMPGTVVTVGLDGSTASETYWSLTRVAADARANPFSGSPDEAVSALERIFGNAVERQLVSDVAVGAFLSGGIDSSSVVALMQRASSRPVKTFTIGFEDAAFDEAGPARAVAAHLGTDHHELIVSPRDAMDVIPQLPSMFSEPFADSSQIPTHLVSKLARAQVTVSLSGDGGDELFGGYNRHVYAHRHWRRIASIPRPLRRGFGYLLQSVPPARWDQLLGPVLRSHANNVGYKVQRTADVIASRSVEDLYHQLIAMNPDADKLMPDWRPLDPFAARDIDPVAQWPAAERMMALDAIQYLPGDILVKVDRAAMAVSLEGRVPLLDPEVVGFAWSLPLDYKIRNGVSKWVLRQMLYRHVPQSLIDRPKAGFGIPIGAWLRGPLRDWAESLLAPATLTQSGLFDTGAVQQLWHQHQRGTRNNEHRLWPLLMVLAWIDNARTAR